MQFLRTGLNVPRDNRIKHYHKELNHELQFYAIRMIDPSLK
jgi:hypothetical protein